MIPLIAHMRHVIAVFATFASLTSASALACSELEEELFIQSSEVKDQCGTGSCWAHPLTSAMEQKIRKERGLELSLSEEFLYVSNMVNDFKRMLFADLEFMAMQKAGEIKPSTVGTIMNGLDEGAHLEDALRLGMVPDSLLSSRVITSSRNIFSNGKRALIADFRKIEKKAKAAMANSSLESVGAQAKLDLAEMTDKHLQKTPNMWRKNEKGQDEFLFKGMWFTPASFVETFIFKSKLKFDSMFHVAARDEILNKIEAKLTAGETIPATLAWTNDPYFSWFHKEFGFKEGEHAIEIVGVIREKGVITQVRIKNSWGTAWKATNWWNQDNGGFLNIPANQFMRVVRRTIIFNAHLRNLDANRLVAYAH